MRVTIFTSNRPRHNYLINKISEVCEDLCIIQECGTYFPGIIPGIYPASNIYKKYFEKVLEAESKIFNSCVVSIEKKNIKTLSIPFNDLNNFNLNSLDQFLKSDLYIVFGSSYIKGDLVKFLIDKKAVNIHMGISPFYRGCDCNFWAMYDNNYYLVGSTIHYLSKGLDSGSILYHAVSEYHDDHFLYSMSTVKSAILSLSERIKNNKIFNYKPVVQNQNVEIRYTQKKDFSENVIREFFNKKIKKINVKENDLLKDPYILQKKNFLN